MHRLASRFDAIVFVDGGLGNQLFDLAFGEKLRRVDNLRVGYDLGSYDQSRKFGHNRFHLLDLGFDVPVASVDEGLFRRSRRLRNLPALIQNWVAGVTHVRGGMLRYQPIGVRRGLTLYAGQWQSPRYFAEVEDDIRALFRDRILASMARDGLATEDAIGFHVRRGDYLTHKFSYDIEYTTYLESALARIREVAGTADREVRVFSDDPDWCEAHLRLPNVEVRRGGSMIEDFIGLMNCRCKIISNSTFSWWAAFLGETEDAVTVAPSRWHAHVSNHDAQILAPNWNIVEV